jgi:hypothetical protein
VAEDDTTTFPLAQCACGAGSGTEASDSTEGSHPHQSAPAPHDAARDPPCSELDVRRKVSEAADPAVSRSDSAGICSLWRTQDTCIALTLRSSNRWVADGCGGRVTAGRRRGHSAGIVAAVTGIVRPSADLRMYGLSLSDQAVR